MVLMETMRPSRKEANAGIEALRVNPYSGRGIVMGLDQRGDTAIQIYWITGRSPDSQNRVIAPEGDHFKTAPADEAKNVGDANLTLYNVTAQVENFHIVSNGKQTDAIADAIKKEASFEEELRTNWNFEDDSNSTPRISGIVELKDEPDFIFSIIKRGEDGESSHSVFYRGKDISPGIGLCIHTYATDGKPTPSFEGAPYPILLQGGLRELGKTYWDLLGPARESGGPDIRVSMLIKTIDIKTGAVGYRIENRFGQSTSSTLFKA